MGRRKRKKISFRPAKTLPKTFLCPSCGVRTIRVNTRYKKTNEGKVLVKCGHCGIQNETPSNDITEPVDAYGDFIDIWFRDQEYARLTKREEMLLQKGQYHELATVYSILADIAQINATKFLEEYEKTKSGEDLQSAEKWKKDSEQYNKNARDLRDKLNAKEIQDAPQDQLYEDPDSVTFANGEAQPLPTAKPKKRVELNKMLDDTGFLEF